MYVKRDCSGPERPRYPISDVVAERPNFLETGMV
jgi:hypothetical protein